MPSPPPPFRAPPTPTPRRPFFDLYKHVYTLLLLEAALFSFFIVQFRYFNNTTYFLQNNKINCIIVSLAHCFLFVLSLYVWGDEKKSRNDLEVVKHRFMSVLVVCLVSLALNVLLGIKLSESGISLNPVSIIKCVFSGLSITMVLFLGPLVSLYYHPEEIVPLQFSTNLLQVRDYVVGPLVEELFFRSIIISVMLKGGFSTIEVMVGSMVFFALAHAHHLYQLPLYRVLFMLFYTSIFGALSSFIFLRTGNFVGPFVSHSFCNYMGFPSVDPNDPHVKQIGVAFVFGMLGFFFLAYPLTDPAWTGSVFYILYNNTL